MRSAATLLVTATTAVLALIAAALAVAAPAWAAGTAYLWTAGGDGSTWTDAANWAPAGVPGTGDSATVLAFSDDFCRAHVHGVPSGLQLADLTVDEHLFHGNPVSPCLTSLDDGSITVTHQFTFHAGTIDTPVTVAAGATGTVTPGQAQDTTHFGGGLTVKGAVTLAANTDPESISLTGGPGITVAAGGTLSTQGDNHVSANCCSSPAHLTNKGTVRLGAGTLDLDAVELDQDKALTAAGGAQVLTTVAPQTAGPGATWSGSGSWQLGASSRTTVTGTQTLGTNFRWLFGGNGSTAEEYLQGTFTLAGTGTFVWGGGQIDAGMTVGASTRVVADGANTVDGRQLDGLDAAGRPVTVTNHGTLTVSGGAGWYGVNGGSVTNAANGSITLGAGTTVGADCCGEEASITNAGGRVTVPPGAGTVTVDNTGYRATGGTLSVGAGSDLELTGLASGSLSTTTITGGGTVGVAQPVMVAGTQTVGAGTTVVLKKGGALDDDGTTVATIGGDGSFGWTGGSVTGALTVSTAGGQTVSGSTEVKHVLVPTGAPSSVLTFAGPTTVVAGTGKAPDTVQSAAAARLTFTGSLAVGADTRLSGGTITAAGATTVAAGNGTAVVAGTSPFVSTGTLTVASGTLQAAVDVDAGRLTGTGSIAGKVVVGAATLAPGTDGHGTLTVKNLAMGGSSTFEVRVGSGDDNRLRATGSAAFAGTLHVVDDDGSGGTVTYGSGSSVTVAFDCSTTTGPGAASEYWTAGVASHRTQLVLTSHAGTPATC